MLCAEKEMQAQASAFEAMLANGPKQHAQNACKTYNFDFFTEKSTSASEDLSASGETFSPFTWREEQTSLEYYKPKIALELKPRMSVSILLAQKGDPLQAGGSTARLSLPGGLSRASLFSQTTSASTNLDESFVSLQTASKMSCFDLFSNSEVKKDEDPLMGSIRPSSRSKTFKQTLTQPVYEEECESGDDDSINNRGSELDS